MSSFLFHQPEFIYRNSNANIVSFTRDRVSIYFTHDGQRLISLQRSTFGGPIMEEGGTLSDLTDLFADVESWSKSNGITTLQIRCFPELYNPIQSEKIKKAMSKAGYETLFVDVDQILPVSNDKIQVKASRKTCILKCMAEGFRFVSLDRNSLEVVYQLSADSRMRKQYPMSMQYAELAETVDRFPDNYLLFGVQDKEKIIAGAVVIMVSSEIAYCFYWGDDSAYLSFSPLSFLIHELYYYTRERGVKLLDLGTSSDQGVINKGVFGFKKSFGSVVTERHTFIKRL